jgi:hypothetical protein
MTAAATIAMERDRQSGPRGSPIGRDGRDGRDGRNVMPVATIGLRADAARVAETADFATGGDDRRADATQRMANNAL